MKKKVVKAQVQPAVRRFVHATSFRDDTDFVEVRMNKKRSTSWVVSKAGIRRRRTRSFTLSECLRFVEMGHWREINFST